MDEPESKQRSSQRSATALGGCAAIGLLVTGVMGLGMMGVLASDRSDPAAGAVALVASALAFGFLINAIYRR
jgi:hypothetical protein